MSPVLHMMTLEDHHPVLLPPVRISDLSSLVDLIVYVYPQ